MTGAILARDSDAWMAGIALPHQMCTSEGKLILEVPRDMLIAFTDFISALARIGVTHVESSCHRARVTEPGRITGHHSTRMVRGDGHVLPEYTITWTLTQDDDGIWRVVKSDSALSTDQWADLPHNDLSQFQREDTDSELRLRKVVQTFFSEADNTLLNGHFQDWRRFYKLPLVVEFNNHRMIIKTTRDLRRDFELYRGRFRAEQVTDITRVIRTAELVGDTLLMATYRAHVLSDAGYIMPAWNGAVTMRHENGRWRIVSILNALPCEDWQPVGGPGENATENRVDRPEPAPVTETPTSGRN
ncbi:hypothetical protein G3256_13890 [Roseobacter ponti]|uniref:SnoaL-like domain-containing protein n=2 Tax=Roseobacter ponti TaxID=1891787 RepID=A0A858SU29_9RHOB|nr:hypothetical protein G3256_13890 [Roseobacter ponti]